MAYTITLSNGTVLTTVANETVDDTTSLRLVGRNYAGYGEIIANDLVHMLENFADVTAPTAPLTGQLWWNPTTQALEVWTSTSWVNVGITADGVITNDVTIQDGSLNFYNSTAPSNSRKWRIRVADESPYVGMLVFEALNDDGSVRNSVMQLDGVNDLIKGLVTYS